MARCHGYLLLAAFCLSLTALSQPYFSRIYPGLPLVRATIAPDSGLVLCAGATSVFSDWAGRLLLRVDRTGSPLWTMAYTTPQAEQVWIRDVALIGDSSYILVGYAGTDWTPNSKMVQQVVDPTGEVVWGGGWKAEIGGMILPIDSIGQSVLLMVVWSCAASS